MKLEYVAGFKSECRAGFGGVRSLYEEEEEAFPRGSPGILIYPAISAIGGRRVAIVPAVAAPPKPSSAGVAGFSRGIRTSRAGSSAPAA